MTKHDHTIEPGEINRRGCVACEQAGLAARRQPDKGGEMSGPIGRWYERQRRRRKIALWRHRRAVKEQAGWPTPVEDYVLEQLGWHEGNQEGGNNA